MCFLKANKHTNRPTKSNKTTNKTTDKKKKPTPNKTIKQKPHQKLLQNLKSFPCLQVLAQRLQLMRLCQTAPVAILYLVHHSCWSGSLVTLYLLIKSFDTSCPSLKLLQLQRCSKVYTAENGRMLWGSFSLQLLWTAAKGSGQEQGLEQVTTTQGHSDSF